MTNAWFLGATMGVPQTEHEARATTEPVRDSAAEADAAPVWNQLETDDTGETNGLARREVASETLPSEQYTPHWTALADENHNKIVDEQVASSGTAAQRETSGVQGHGTMQYALGIEPVIREGAALGADYFRSNEHDIQEHAGAYMLPANGDNYGRAVTAHQAEASSREAYQSSLYDAYLKGVM